MKGMEFIKKNITLIVGISIPTLMILFIAGSIYLPILFIHPRFNFLYASNNDYYYSQSQYSVQNGKFVMNKIQVSKKQNYQQPKKLKLYIYNVTKDKSREVSLKEVQKLNLDTSKISPDGFRIAYSNGGYDNSIFSVFFPSGTDSSIMYLKGHNVNKKIYPQLSGQYYNFSFIGWIK